MTSDDIIDHVLCDYLVKLFYAGNNINENLPVLDQQPAGNKMVVYTLLSSLNPLCYERNHNFKVFFSTKQIL